MNIIFEKLITEIIDDKEITYFVECSEAEATHIHYCYNDENKPCKRVLK